MEEQDLITRIPIPGRRSIPAVLTTLMNLTTNAVLVFDEQGTIVEGNNEACHLFQLAPDGMVGENVSSFIVAADGMDVAGEWPFPVDGSSQVVSCRSSSGGRVMSAVRCERVAAPDPLYLLVAERVDADVAIDRENTRLVSELRRTNHRLRGTLDIVMETHLAQDMGELFGHILEELKDTMEASGTIVYINSPSGFTMRGCSDSLAEASLPTFLAFGEAVESMAASERRCLRLSLLRPTVDELRREHIRQRRVVDEDTKEIYFVPARSLPPFESFLCAPVFFGGQLLAVIDVGWNLPRDISKDECYLLDTVAHHLSDEIAATFTQMRANRIDRLDQASASLREQLASAPLDEDILSSVVERGCDALEAAYVHMIVDEGADSVRAVLPDVGEVELPFTLDQVEGSDRSDVVSVVNIDLGGELSSYLAAFSPWCVGALVDAGTIGGKRRCAMALRLEDSEPMQDVDLGFLHRLADDVRQLILGAHQHELDTHISQALQQGMRNELQDVEGITAHALYSSATAAAFVGGDFYDLIRLPRRRCCVILGDVSGKGVEAASVSASVKVALGAYAWEGQSPAHMVRLLNDFLLGFSRLETFATLFVGLIDLDEGLLTYCSAGHPPALLLRADTGEITSLDVQSGIVGAFKTMTYNDGVVRINPGDQLLLYTDGVTEARDGDGGFYGEAQLREAFLSEAATGFDGICDRLLERLDTFTGRHLEDDVAMLSLRLDDDAYPAPSNVDVQGDERS